MIKGARIYFNNLFYTIAFSFIIYSCQFNKDSDKKPKQKVFRGVDYETYVLFLNSKDPLLNKKFFLKALSYSIDRNYIVNAILNGEGVPAINGIIPTAFNNYPIKKVNGYDLNIDSAQFYIKKSGIEKIKKDFTLKIISVGVSSIEPPEELQKQWKLNLGINVNIEVVRDSLLWTSLIKGDEGIYLIPIHPLAPYPQAFLEYFYSKSSASIVSKDLFNPQFDEYYELSFISVNNKVSIENLLKAEQILMDEAIVIPIWYTEQAVAYKSSYQEIPYPVSPNWDLSKVYIKK